MAVPHHTSIVFVGFPNSYLKKGTSFGVQTFAGSAQRYTVLASNKAAAAFLDGRTELKSFVKKGQLKEALRQVVLGRCRLSHAPWNSVVRTREPLVCSACSPRFSSPWREFHPSCTRLVCNVSQLEFFADLDEPINENGAIVCANVQLKLGPDTVVRLQSSLREGDGRICQRRILRIAVGLLCHSSRRRQLGGVG